MPTKQKKSKKSADQKLDEIPNFDNLDLGGAASNSIPPLDANSTETQEKSVKKKLARVRSRRYAAARSKVDKTRTYDLPDAVKLVQELSYTKFDGTIEAHLEVREVGATATLTFPHSTGKSVSVAIFNSELEQKIKNGQIDFDILIARPEDMKNLAKHARVLGPKGLMPNPKNGTISLTPEKRKTELEAGSITLKTEKKAPLIHITVGKVSMESKKLEENILALVKAFANKTVRLSLSATMSPSVKVTLQKELS